MPTENRSSNTEMVSVPRELLERLDLGKNTATALNALPELRAILARPAEQSQGEPVALPSCNAKLSDSHDWDQGYRGGWRACLDEIAKLGPLYTRPVQGEPVAWQDPDNDSRMCTAEHKAYALSKGGAPATALATLTRPLYTRADPGEVERLQREAKNDAIAYKAAIEKQEELRADLETMRRKNNEYCDEVMTLRESKAMVVKSEAALFQEVERLREEVEAMRLMTNDYLLETETLRAKQAKRYLLLRQANGLLKVSAERLPSKHQTIREHIDHLRDSIEADLSASAEPSAPVERDERAASL